MADKLKKKHRDRLWVDVEGDAWFWNADTENWACLVPDLYGGYAPTLMQNPNKTFGPFTELLRSSEY